MRALRDVAPMGLLLGLLLALGACLFAGSAVRDQSLRAMSVAWPAIAQDVRLGAAVLERDVEAQIEQVQAALDGGARGALVGIDWLDLKSMAAAGIMSEQVAGRISPGVAQSLHVQLQQFDVLWTKVTAK